MEGIRQVVGPARCGPVAGIGAVGAGAGGGPGLGPEGVATSLVTATMVCGHKSATVPYTQVLPGGSGAEELRDSPDPVVSPDPAAWPPGRLGTE